MDIIEKVFRYLDKGIDGGDPIGRPYECIMYVSIVLAIVAVALILLPAATIGYLAMGCKRLGSYIDRLFGCWNNPL